MPRLLRYVLAYFLIAPLLGWGLYHAGWGDRYLNLAEHGQAVTAAIDRTTCSDHGRYLYVFTLAGQTYRGFASGDAPKPCGELSKGDPIAVVYLPDDPSINTSGDPQARLHNAVFSAMVAALFMPAFPSGRPVPRLAVD